MRKTLATITSSMNSKKSNSNINNMLSSSSSSSQRMISEENQEQSVRDIKLAIEFRNLKQSAPSGVYILPSIHNIRLYFGVIFIRRGAYANAVFKFTIKLPTMYNGINTWPTVIFTAPSNIYNSYIDYDTGELNVKEAFPRWDPQKHYLVTLLTYIKKIFYIKNFENTKNAILNFQAYDMACNNIDIYKKNIKDCVMQSKQGLIQNNNNDDDNDDNTLKYPAEINGVDNNNNMDAIVDAKLLSEQVQYNLFWKMLKDEYINDPSKLTKSKIIELIEDENDEDDNCLNLY